MSLRINHNIASINGHRQMLKNDAMISSSLEKLSSGLRINRAADDAAGLIISEQMRAQISGLGQAVNNSETAVSMVQTAEGALDEMNTLLNKARSLALHANNEGANDQNQLVADQSELDNIVDSIDRISKNTQFGTKKLLDGSLSSVRANLDSVSSVATGGQYNTWLADGTIKKGYHSIEVTTTATQATLNIAMPGADTGLISGGSLDAMGSTDQFLGSFSFSLKGVTINVVSGSTKKNLFDNLAALGKSLGYVAAASGASATLSGNIVLTAKEYGGEYSFNLAYVGGDTGATIISGTFVTGDDLAATLYLNTGVAGGVNESGGSTTVDLSGHGLLMKYSGWRVVLNQALVTGYYAGAIDGNSAGASFQIGANVGQKATVELSGMRATDLGVGASGSFSSLAQLKGGSLINGQGDDALRVIDKAIDDVTVTRGRLGAFQANTLESGLNSLRTTQENLTAAESSIRDVDFAEESANFTKNSILVQASTAMLAQANQLPQNVLKLLG